MYKIGIDVGGTFTDIVLQDRSGKMAHGKVPSIPGNEAQAVINALGLMAEREQCPLPEFLAEVELSISEPRWPPMQCCSTVAFRLRC